MAARFPKGKNPEFPVHCNGTRKKREEVAERPKHVSSSPAHSPCDGCSALCSCQPTESRRGNVPMETRQVVSHSKTVANECKKSHHSDDASHCHNCDLLWNKGNKVSVWSLWVIDANRKCNQGGWIWHQCKHCAWRQREVMVSSIKVVVRSRVDILRKWSWTDLHCFSQRRLL